MESLKRHAQAVDYIILCLGEDGYAEETGNIDDLMLPENQLILAQTAIATRKPVILILAEGRPRLVRTIEPDMQAILLAYRPASMGAVAIAEVLFGDYNPSGKLPFSYPKFSDNLITYDCTFRECRYYQPQWAFGHGFSYTKFEYGQLQLSNDSFSGDETLEVTLPIKNIGSREGMVAIDLFIRDLFASIIPPQRRLRHFTKVALTAGEEKTIQFTLTKADLAFVNRSLQTVVEEGGFKVIVGEQEATFFYQN